MSRTAKLARADKLSETHDYLIEAVESLTTGDDWRRMLDVARHFHIYSPNNIWLILAQRPEATRVAGFKTWKRLGRFVKAGEHGIAILAPCVYPGQTQQAADETEHAEPARVLRGFRVVHVFDLAQTDGDPIDDVAPVLLEGGAPTGLWYKLADQLASASFELLRSDCSPANGRTDFLARIVVVRPDLSPAQALKTLVHELAHTCIHDGTEYSMGCRGVAEVEAESVAYLVCSAAGVATDGYTFPYIARWVDGDAGVVRKTAERAITCARQILSSADIVVDRTAGSR